MTAASHQDEDWAQLGLAEVELPAPLAEYAEGLLQSSGLSTHDALLIASGHTEPPPGLEAIASALRAGWATGSWREQS
jgi:hypothetical protein